MDLLDQQDQQGSTLEDVAARVSAWKTGQYRSALRGRVAERIAGGPGDPTQNLMASQRAAESPDIAQDYPDLAREAAKELFRAQAVNGAREAPESAASRLKLGAQLGVPADALRDPVMRKSMEDVAKWVQLPAHELVGTSLGNWLASKPENMSLAMDDLDQLQKIGRAESALGSWINRSNSLGQGITTDFGRLSESILDRPIWNFLAPVLPEGLMEWKKKQWREIENIRKAVDESVFDPGKTMGKGMINPEYWAVNAVAGSAPDIALALVTSGFGTAASSMSKASAGASLVTRIGTYIANRAPQLMAQTATSFPGILSAEADEYQQFNPGASRVEAVGKAAVSALAQAVAEGIVEVPIIEKMQKAKGVYQRLLGLFASSQMEGAEEVAQRVLSQALLPDPSGKRDLTAAELFDNWRGGVVAGAFFGAAAIKAPKTTPAEVFFDTMAKGAQDSKLLQRMPEKFQEAVAAMLKGGKVESFGIPAMQWVTYWQSQGLTPEQVQTEATALGVQPEAYQEALNTGGDLQIDTAAFTTRLAATEHSQGLVKDVRLAPGEQTMREAEESKAEVQQRVEEILNTIQETPEDASIAQVSQIQKEMKAQLTAAGRPAAEANAAAKGFAEAVATLAVRNNMPVPDLMKMFDLKVTNGQVVARPASVGTDPANSAVLYQELSTRVPFSKKTQVDHIGTMLLSDLESLKTAPAANSKSKTPFGKAADLISEYVNHKKGKNDTPEKTVEKFIDHVVKNLLWLHDQMPPELRSRARLWYDGARTISERWSGRYEKTPKQIAGIIGVLSPQRDWFQNVSLGQRILDILTNQQDFAWDAKMSETADRIYADPKFGPARAGTEGKKLSEISGKYERAFWLRAYDEAHNPKHHRSVSPEGDFGDFMLNNPDKKGNRAETSIAWGSLDQIEKAISIFEDGSPENISVNLGGAHKVRNFYNNIFAPNSKNPFVTMDTHAVAAGLLRPLAGSDLEVTHNLGAGVSSAEAGLSGTYPIFAEAYKRAAEARRVLPREMQSITWEAVRGLFPDTFKTPANKQAVESIWKAYNKGKVTLDEAHQQISDLAGGITPPSWSGGGVHDQNWGSTYTDELSRPRLPGRSAGGVDAGTGDGTSSLGADPGVVPGPTTLNQSVYHGSPHKFDKFTTDKIGTGEGHQAYGWGLYFAGSNEVAEFYRKNLSEGYLPTFKKDGVVLDGAEAIAQEYFKPGQVVEGYAGRDKVVAFHPGTDSENWSVDVKEVRADGTDAGYRIRNHATFPSDKQLAKVFGDEGWTQSKGQTYKVEIPDTGYLLWNKPFSEQPKEVQDALKGVATGTTLEKLLEGKTVAELVAISKTFDKDSTWDELVDDNPEMTADELRGYLMDSYNDQDMNDYLGNEEFDQTWSGQSIYRQLSTKLGGDMEASKRLNALGVTGIKYLDNFSRGVSDTSKESFNYVIFDDAAVNVLETYYQPGARGSLSFQVEGETTNLDLSLFKTADVSTAAHEFGHAYLVMLEKLASAPNAPQQIQDDFLTVLDKFGTDGKIDRAAHERFADAHLLYLEEGNAPSEALRPVFQRFSGWLKKTWGFIKANMVDVELSPEIRGVFDRIYATDAEIELAKNDLTRPFATAEEANMTEAQFAFYQKTYGSQIAEGKERMLAVLMKELQQEQSAERKELLREAYDRIFEEISSMPEYVALAALADGTVAKLSAESLRQMGVDPNTLGAEGIMRVWSNDPTAVDPETAANLITDEWGEPLFPNGVALIEALTGLESRKKFATRLAEDEVSQTFLNTLDDPEALRLLAVESLEEGGPAYDRVKAQELRSLRQAMRFAGRVANDAVSAAASAARTEGMAAAKVPDLTPYRLAAREKVSGVVVGNLKGKAWEYLRTSRKAGNDSLKLMAKGKYAEASQAKEREILNHFMYLEAKQAQAEVRAFGILNKRLGKADTQSKIGMAGGTFLDQIIKLRNRFGLSEQGLLDIPNVDRQTLAEWILDNPDAEIDDRIVDETWRKPAENLTLEEMRAVRDALNCIRVMARMESTVLADGKRVSLEQAETELEGAIAAGHTIRPPEISEAEDLRKDKVANMLAGADALFIKIEQLVNWMDGDNVNGPAHRYILQPFVEGQTRRYDMLAEISAPLDEAFMALPEEIRNGLGQRFQVSFVPGGLSRQQIISMAYNMGNSVNKMKLLEGYGWTEAQVLEAMSHLTRDELALVQRSWDIVAGLWPDMVALEKRTVGVEPKQQVITAFSVRLNDGTSVDMEGGYWPLKYDPNAPKNEAAARKQNAADRLLNGSAAKAGTSRSATKERTRYVGPLLLDFRLIMTGHINDVIMDITHREAFNSVDKFLRRSKVKEAIQGAFGVKYYRQFEPWLKTIAGDGSSAAAMGVSDYASAIMMMRSHIVTAMLGYKFTSTVVQFADLGRVVGASPYSVPVWNVAKAFWQFINAPTETLKMIRELSGEMKHRVNNLDRDIREIMNKRTGQQTLLDRFNRAAFKPFAWMDTFASTLAFLGKYQQKMTEHGDSTRAVKEAEQTVRALLQTGNPKDLIAVQRNSEAVKLMTMFMGDQVAGYNMMRNAGHRAKGLGGFAVQFAPTVVQLSILALFADWLKGQWEDDKKKQKKWLAVKAMMAPFNSIPVVSTGARALENELLDKYSKFNVSPAFGAVENVIKTIGLTKDMLGSEKQVDKVDYALKFGETLGQALGIGGTSQAVGTARYFVRLKRGEERPKNRVVGPGGQAAYDALRGKPRERK